MLETDARQLLLDALRPPSGFALDMAVGTSYSLDLLALMTTPVAFAMFDRQGDDGSAIDDPIATLQALRAYASRITLFCQAGQIAVPPEFRLLLVYLEDSVYPVVPPRPEAIFHPKVWYLRFRDANDAAVAYRLLCLSRNLTFDRSWDTMLRLDGAAGDGQQWPELARFADSLIAMAQQTHPVGAERAAAIRGLGREFAHANWTLPAGFDEIRFWPLGDDGQMRWPIDGRRDRTLVVSPFVTEGTLNRLTQRHGGSILLTSAESFEQLGSNAVRHLAERLVLALDESSGDGGESSNVVRMEATAEAPDRGLNGLHAKLYVADAGRRARCWTGSANATDAAFQGNVEFLVELGGRKDHCGVGAIVGDTTNRLGLRRLVEPYEPSEDPPQPPPDPDGVEWRLDRARRAIGGLRYSATCALLPSERWRLTLEGVATATSVDAATLDGMKAVVRPVTLGQAAATTPSLTASGLSVSFDLSETGLTPYFAMTLALDDAEAAFLVAAELIDPPSGRAERVLSTLLANRADLIRFLLLLLGNVDDALASFDSGANRDTEAAPWLVGVGSEALFEPLVRTYSRDPGRLLDIKRVIDELSRNPDHASILPERWNEIWEPIAAALAKDAPR